MVKLTEQKILVDRTLMIKAATQMVSYTSTDKKKRRRRRRRGGRRPIFFNALLKCWMINAPSSNFSFHIRRSTLVDPLSYLHLNLESSVKRLKRALFAR